MSKRTAIDAYLAQVRASLGWRRLLEPRALSELRHHLDCAVDSNRRKGMTEEEAQHAALDALGTVEQTTWAVVHSNVGLRMFEMARDRLLLTCLLLTLPGILLLGLSFFTFNFPCGELTAEYKGDTFAYQGCGLSFLQPLRPWLSEFGISEMGAWYQITHHLVTTLAPLIAAILLIAAQTRIRAGREEGAAAPIVVLKPEAQRMAALALSLLVFISVAAYKLAG